MAEQESVGGRALVLMRRVKEGAEAYKENICCQRLLFLNMEGTLRRCEDFEEAAWQSLLARHGKSQRHSSFKSKDPEQSKE
jgi:hypothetical protein